VEPMPTSASRHKWWAMVYDIKNSTLRTGLRSVMPIGFESLRLEPAGPQAKPEPSKWHLVWL